MAEKKYLDLTGLEHYDSKIKELIPLVSYITGLESGKIVDGNGAIQIGSNQITNKVYVEPGMKLYTYGTGSIQSTIRQHLYNEDGSYNGYIDYTAQGDDILNIDRGISIFEEIGGGVTRMYLAVDAVSHEELESAINEIDLHYPTYISTITSGETIDESTGEVISTPLDQYDRTYYLTNKFYTTQKFTVNYSAISTDVSGQIKVYSYNINDELADSVTFTFVNGVNSLTLTPSEGEYYFVIEILANSCSYINVQPAVDLITTAEIDASWT